MFDTTKENYMEAYYQGRGGLVEHSFNLSTPSHFYTWDFKEVSRPPGD